MHVSGKLSALGAAVVVAVTPAAALAHGKPAARATAERQCRTELRTMGSATFRGTYGTNGHQTNAFGKCVAHRTRQNAADQATSQSNAAQTCRAQQSDSNFAASHNGKTFAAFYGTNQNGANAFGKCVASQARSQAQQAQTDEVNAEDSAAQTCSSEQSSDASAFRSKYGTNANGANAFGKCVSETAKSNEDQQSQSDVSDEQGSGSTTDAGSSSSQDTASSHGDQGRSHQSS
jgi:hypothetical protein